MTFLFEMLALAGLILLNAFFVAAEYGLVTSRRTRIMELEHAGNRRARAVLRITNDPPRFIFVELKSDDVSNAEKQIRSTAKIVGTYIPKKIQPRAVLIGLIVLRSGVPSSRNRRDKDGKKIAQDDSGLRSNKKAGLGEMQA